MDMDKYRRHRDYIDCLIEKDRKKAQMFDAVKLHIVKMGSWSIITILGFLVWYWLSHHGGKP